MSVSKELFGVTPSGEEVFLYKVDNGHGMTAEFINLGCIIKKLVVNDKNSQPVDVALGRETLEEYLKNDGFLGAVVGRVANRIRNAEFKIDGETYHVSANKGTYTLHGGFVSFGNKVWEGICEDESGCSVSFELKSPDGDEGFPGNLDVVVTYTLTEDNTLDIHYEAVSDKDTVVNLTNHSYFNLNGHGSGSVVGHKVKLNCSFYTPTDENQVPYGEIFKVEGTPFDFREFKTLAEDIDSDDEQMKIAGGFDHNWIIDGTGLREAAVAIGDKTGIKMTTYTDKPGVQMYTANYLKGDRKCKDGAIYSSRDAVCFETQLFPNSTEITHFPSPVLRCGDKYDFTTRYSFGIE